MDVFKLAGAVILSFGGAGAIIIYLSGWLGRVWAHRIMEKERAEHAMALEQLRADLSYENNRRLDEMKSDLMLLQKKHFMGHFDQIQIYRMVVDVISDLLADLDLHFSGQLPSAAGGFVVDRFNRRRLKAYGYLSMLASQEVMDSYDALVDHLFSIINGQTTYEWTQIRQLAIKLINVIRVDIGLNISPVEYRGQR